MAELFSTIADLRTSYMNEQLANETIEEAEVDLENARQDDEEHFESLEAAPHTLPDEPTAPPVEPSAHEMRSIPSLDHGMSTDLAPSSPPPPTPASSSPLMFEPPQMTEEEQAELLRVMQTIAKLELLCHA